MQTYQKEFNDNKNRSAVFTQGSTTISQQLAPASISYTSEHEIKIENSYAKSFVINGYPSRVSLNWMDQIYSYDGDMDVSEHIEPANERTALDELTAKITQYEAQYMAEVEKGSIKNLSVLQSKIDVLMQQRARLEQNYENLFHVSTFCTMYGQDLKELNKEAQKFQSRLSGSRINVMPLNLRQDEGVKSNSPFGILTIPEYSRNMNTGALSTMFPFYNSDVNDVNGTFIGVNALRNTPILVDLFNRRKLGNANLFISGASGSGKSYLTSLIVMRSSLEGVKHCIIDPENEYGDCCDALGGITIRIAPNSNNMMNPFDIDSEIETDGNGNPTGRRFVDIKGKVSELLNLFGVMFSSIMDVELKADIDQTLTQLYEDFGFTRDEESLYQQDTAFNPETGQYYHDKILKVMPTMSDFREKLKERAQYFTDIGDERSVSRLVSLINAMSLYCKEGTFGLFDCYSTIDTTKFESAPVIRFDVQGIEDEVLRPIGMHIALSWAFNKFMKKDSKVKKRIICDEAWMMLSQSMAGSEYTAHFLENCARRVRKYNGSLCCASQNFREFVSRNEGQAILSNSAVRIFLRQQPEDIAAVGERFILSDGEKQFLLTAGRGDALMKIANESVVAKVFAFPFEHDLISNEDLED